MSIKTIFFDIGDTLVKKNQWMPGAKQAVAELRQAKRRVGLLSNTGNLDRDRLAGLLPEDFDFADFTEDLVLLSSETGCEKPGLAAFLLAAQHAGNPPWETLFVGESLSETLAAQEAGLMAARCVVEGDIERLVKRIIEA